MFDDATCHGAAEARDRRYDGLFFIGVTSTGIYCRCVCPARTPKKSNRRFFPSAAAAEGAGFRPCLLCRPELAPGAAPIDAAERLAHAAVRRIEAGALESVGVEDIARELGVTDRHLRRVMLRVFGATPVEIAQTHRLLTAKRLLRDTNVGMTRIAFAAGFQSVRRFNALFRERYGMAPSRVRAARGKQDTGLSFTLAARGEFDGRAPFAHYTGRCVARMEAVAGGHTFTRTFAAGEHAGVLTLDFGGPAPRLTLSDELLPAFRSVVASVRAALDLDTDITVVNGTLARAGFARDVMRDPSVRLPGALDPFEVAIRAVVGQQVTVKAATTVVGRIVDRFGAPIETSVAGLDRLFPTAERLAGARPASIAKLGMPFARAQTVQRLAAAVADGTLVLRRGAIATGRAALAGVPGVGPWTLEYIALRALGDPDAFPFGDSALRAAFDGDLASACEAWRPWRAYAAARLWRRTPVAKRKTAKSPRRKVA
jgi:AraC family transcriptional regulator of adaptative response / DNA-3-methyladenine glycosylase II